MTMDMKYNSACNTYDLIVDGEWYAEGNYEQMDDMMRAMRDCELEEEIARCTQPSDYYGDIDSDDWDDC